MENNKENQIQLPEEVAEGTYSNLAIIAHSSSEFVIDFVRLMPGVPKAKVQSRIILTPEHAKRLLFALNDNVKRFEEQNGFVDLEKGQMGFMPPIDGNLGEA